MPEQAMEMTVGGQSCLRNKVQPQRDREMAELVLLSGEHSHQIKGSIIID